MQPVEVYGADWCGDTQHTLEHLSDLGVPFNFFNIEEDGNADQWIREHNHGKLKLPTVDVAGTVLSIPSDAELDRALRERGMMA